MEQVQLDDTAKMLNTERRRIYDIVNVFEAVQIMSRVNIGVFLISQNSKIEKVSIGFCRLQIKHKKYWRAMTSFGL